MRPNNTLVVNAESPDAVKQGTLDEEIDRRREKRPVDAEPENRPAPEPEPKTPPAAKVLSEQARKRMEKA